MLLIGIVALAAALLIGISLAAGIIRPVRALVSAMHTVLRGDLRHHAQVDRGDEIGFLARSFNEMVDGLQEREHIKNTFGRFVSRDVAEAVLDGRIPLGLADIALASFFINARYAGFTPDRARWPKVARFLEDVLAEPVLKKLMRFEAIQMNASIKGRRQALIDAGVRLTEQSWGVHEPRRGMMAL